MTLHSSSDDAAATGATYFAAQTIVNELRPALSLDGEWTFRFGDEAPQTILVPAPWESQRPDLRNRAGTAVYEHAFSVPPAFRDRRVILRFGAVDYFAEVWVNDVSVGVHEGGYTPFEFDITSALQGEDAEALNNLRVRVTDATVEQDAVLPDGKPLAFAEIPHGKQSWYTSVGGIWQSVTLEGRPQNAIVRAIFLPDIDQSAATLHLTLEGFAVEDGKEWHARVRFEQPDGAGPVETVIAPINQANRTTNGRIALEQTFQIPVAKLWSPETPSLYRALITLERAVAVVDAVSATFGMRKIEAREGRVWLNNAPIFLAGTLDQDFYPRTIYTPPSEEFLRDQFHKAKEMGLNLMRCHIKVPDEAYLRLCDEIGLLVWYEIPNGARLSHAFRERARQTLQAMWERDANHPCIIIASLINESWGINLNDDEQRRWLHDTYHWAKSLLPSWLVVDNSPCIPNFHLVSDLEDYHIYFNIPDQANAYTEWVKAFASRQVGAYTGYGDGEHQRNEPLILSEFGNWGLPSLDKILEAEGGEPYWFKTGGGATRPEKVLERFEAQGLLRAFTDYNALAEASQEQQWLSLKWEIEEMRRHSEIGGYVITEFTDLNWECNGLLDMGRNPKAYHHRLKDLQSQDILIPRLSPRTSLWEGETATLSVEFSCFTGRSIAGGVLAWEVDGFAELKGETVVQHKAGETAPNYGSYPIAQLPIAAPSVSKPTKSEIRLVLRDKQGAVVARTTQNIVFVPASLRSSGQGKTVWLHDPLNAFTDLRSTLTALDYRVVAQPEPGALGLATHWDSTLSAFLLTGGKAILVATETKSLTSASGLGINLQDRSANGWWGDWCTTKTWFAREHFPSLPDIARFDFEFQPIMPKKVVTGPLSVNIVAGLFAGWLHNPAALVAQVPIGRGDLTVTTFNLLPNIGRDPIATLMLNDLFNLPSAARSV